ncbi:hypothetical protein KAI78_02770 [bacterium]|nr:hypothetical protein [bacterium]
MKKILFFLIILVCISPVFGDSWFSQDKLMHFSYSFASTLWSYPFARYQLEMEHSSAITLSFSVTLTTGVFKEITDSIRDKKLSSFSYKDLVWDLAGSGTAIILLLILFS